MTTKPNFRNRTLFHGDNLHFLRGMDSETVDLVVTDPPIKEMVRVGLLYRSEALKILTLWVSVLRNEGRRWVGNATPSP